MLRDLVDDGNRLHAATSALAGPTRDRLRTLVDAAVTVPDGEAHDTAELEALRTLRDEVARLVGDTATQRAERVKARIFDEYVTGKRDSLPFGEDLAREIDAASPTRTPDSEIAGHVVDALSDARNVLLRVETGERVDPAEVNSALASIDRTSVFRPVDSNGGGYRYEWRLTFTTDDPDHTEPLNRLQEAAEGIIGDMLDRDIPARLTIRDTTPGGVTDRDVLTLDTAAAGDGEDDGEAL